MLVLGHSITPPSFINFGKNARLVALFPPLVGAFVSKAMFLFHKNVYNFVNCLSIFTKKHSFCSWNCVLSNRKYKQTTLRRKLCLKIWPKLKKVEKLGNFFFQIINTHCNCKFIKDVNTLLERKFSLLSESGEKIKIG